MDIYNLQTQTGLPIRCDPDRISGASANAFYGYFGFASKDLALSAIGLGTADGDWGGILSSAAAMLPRGANVHLTVEVNGSALSCTLTNIESGRVYSATSCADSAWSGGTFGIRMLNRFGSQESVGKTSFDNLTVTVHS